MPFGGHRRDGYDVTTVSTLLVALTAGQLGVTATFFHRLARKYSHMVPWGRLGLILGVFGLGLLAGLPLLTATADPVVLCIAVAGLTPSLARAQTRSRMWKSWDAGRLLRPLAGAGGYRP